MKKRNKKQNQDRVCGHLPSEHDNDVTDVTLHF